MYITTLSIRFIHYLLVFRFFFFFFQELLFTLFPVHPPVSYMLINPSQSKPSAFSLHSHLYNLYLRPSLQQSYHQLLVSHFTESRIQSVILPQYLISTKLHLSLPSELIPPYTLSTPYHFPLTTISQLFLSITFSFS